MKRFLAVGLTLVISMFALSCQKIVDDTTAQVVDDLTFADSPAWEGSVWTGTKESDVYVKNAVTDTSTSDSVVKSRIPLKSVSITLTFNADKTFTKTSTTVWTAAAETNYIRDNYLYSTSSAFFNPPASAANYAYYEDSNGNQVNRIAGEDVQNGDADNYVKSIATTASATYNNVAVYPVTYKTALTGLLSGRTISTQTQTGTWEAVQKTTDPLNKTSYLKLTPASIAGTDYEYYENAAGTAVLTDTKNWTYTVPAGETLEFEAIKAVDSTGKDIYYAVSVDDETYLYLN